ncbi:isochorismatase family protein [Streptomyces sp. NPDC002394]
MTQFLLLIMKREVPGGPAPLDGTVEEPLLSTGFDHPDIVSFGVRGVSPGYVGRSGVAYASRSRLTTARARETAELIPRAGWTDLVFCGIAAESCVLKSAADAFEHGYAPWIVTDTCASASDTGPHVHDAGLLVAAVQSDRVNSSPPTT